jgi:hypothetical protein
MGRGHAVGPMALTETQNDQIRVVQLETISQLTATPNGGYVRASTMGQQSHKVIALAATRLSI